MEASKALSKQIFIEVVVAFVFLGVALIGGYAIYSAVKGHNVVKDGDLILDVNKDEAPRNLYIMGDQSGLSTKPYVVNVTNNGKKDAGYKLLLSHSIVATAKVEDYLRVSIDDTTIKNLKDFKVDKNGNYIIWEEDLKKGYTDTHRIKLWFASNSPNVLSGADANVRFLVSVK